MKRLAIFASGNGTNAEEIIKHFAKHDEIEVACVMSNKKDAYVLERANNHKIPTQTFTKSELSDGVVTAELKKHSVDFVILAGFLLLIPQNLLQAFTNRIINIHPALLPKHGGKGMYGEHVHKAVKAHGDSETGITIHLVNEEYDKGKVLFQKSVEVLKDDTPASIASKVHRLEYAHYPRVIEQFVMGK